MHCPICNQEGTRADISGPGGRTAFLTCCYVPLEIVDNWEEWAGVPESKRLAAVERGRAEVHGVLGAMRQDARAFLDRRYGHAD